MFNKIRSTLLKLYRKFFFHTPPDSNLKVRKIINGKKIQLFSGGSLNKDKTFYIIQRFGGEGGLFSDLVFVVNHLKIAKDHGFIPIVDMENYPRWYNENKKIKNSLNSWNYYFKPVSNYSLDEVYKSRNLIMTSKIFYSNIDFKYSIHDSIELKDIFNEYIHIEKKIQKIVEKLEVKKFKKKKILGVHFRGTSYKYGRNPHPATLSQMKRKIKKILQEEKYDKVFLVSEDISHFKYICREFNENIIYLENTFRSKGKVAFETSPRLNHRYKLGRDLLIEACLLSKCDGYLDTRGNVMNAVMTMNSNKSQKRYLIDNGDNKGIPLLGNYIWYIKNLLPHSLGGFEN